MFKVESTPILYKLFQKIEEKVTVHNSLYGTSIIFIPKPDKDIPRKLHHYEYRLKILNKMLVHQIQQHIKRIIYYDQVGLIPGMQGWL